MRVPTSAPVRCSALIPVTLLILQVATANASGSTVQFDVPHVVPCRDVTGESELVSGERLVEAHLEVSTLVSSSSAQLQEFFFRFTSPTRSLPVADYQPKTTLASDYAGNISVDNKKESNKSAGLAISGVWEPLVKITGSGDLGSKNTAGVRYELVAPLQPVTASGTTDRGFGVYYKFKASRQHALEGAKQFVIRFRVPPTWRGDYLQVHCEAFGAAGEHRASLGRRDFFVALYQAGDEGARWQAEQMAAAEAELQHQIWEHRSVFQPRESRNVLGMLNPWSKKSSSENLRKKQLEQLIFDYHQAQPPQIPKQLPTSLREALASYLTARQSLHQLDQYSTR